MNGEVPLKLAQRFATATGTIVYDFDPGGTTPHPLADQNQRAKWSGRQTFHFPIFRKFQNTFLEHFEYQNVPECVQNRF